MNSVVGHTAIYNIIIIFILIFFAFIIGTLSYYKAFKVNNRIIYSIEKFEGYNELSSAEIKKIAGNFGYVSHNTTCERNYKGMELVSKESGTYCVYIDNMNPRKGSIYNYGVLTYMNIDLPLVNNFNIPIFTRANRLYKFTSEAQPEVGE